jgi:ribonuclease HI
VEGWVKVNCDASLNKSLCRVGLGIVIRDHDGRVLSAKCISKEGAVDPGAAEAMALSQGVSLCISSGFRNVFVEGDAKIVFDALLADNSRSSRLGVWLCLL